MAETQAQLFVNLDSTFGAFARVARPFIQETITETPPTFDTLTRTGPRDQVVPRPQRHAVRRPATGHQGAQRDLARGRLRAGNGRQGPAGRPGAQRQLPPTANTLFAFSQDAGVQGGIKRSTQLFSIAHADAQVRHPGAVGVQLRVAPAPQRPEPAQRRRRGRHKPTVPDPGRRADQPVPAGGERAEQREQPLLGTGQRPGGSLPAELPPREPVSVHRLSGSAARVRGRATRSTSRTRS